MCVCGGRGVEGVRGGGGGTVAHIAPQISHSGDNKHAVSFPEHSIRPKI